MSQSMPQPMPPTAAHHLRPTRRGRRGLTGLAGLVVLVVSTFGAAPTPAAAQVVNGAPCAPGEGVTVVVDFTSLGDGVEIRCAPGAQATGFAALAAAGFTVGTEAGPGSVCTIDGRPTEGYPYCWATGGYWSYWKKPLGGSWGFSGTGPGGGPLAVDAVEGWAWAQDFSSAAPRADESTVPPTTTTTTTTTSTPPTPTTSTTTTPLTSSTVPTSTSTTVPDTTVPDTTAPPAPTSPSEPVDPTDPSAVPATVDSPPGAPPAAGPGSGPGSGRAPLARTGGRVHATTLAGALVLALGVLTAGSARRLGRTRA